VVVQLREGQLKKVVLGVGISTDSGPRLSVEHTNHKLPWLGWRALSKLSLDDKTRSLGTELTAPPDADNWRWITSAQVQRQKADGVDVSSQRWRGPWTAATTWNTTAPTPQPAPTRCRWWPSL
jgi:translocation and assembly module TamA